MTLGSVRSLLGWRWRGAEAEEGEPRHIAAVQGEHVKPGTFFLWMVQRMWKGVEHLMQVIGLFEVLNFSLHAPHSSVMTELEFWSWRRDLLNPCI